MISIDFETPAGTVRVQNCEVGQTLMKVAVENDVDGIVAECGGELSCATCHVQLPVAVIKDLPPASADELELLEAVDDSQPTSRLACQVRITEAFDRSTVRVPSAG